jgi:branched-chain amino acid transport system substrate-binding protein
MNKKIWIGMIVIIAIIVAVVLVKEKKQPSMEGSIKIGAALGLTGDSVVWGEAERNSIQMAVDEINGKGGIKGKKIEVITEDTKSTNQGVVSAASKLINVDKVSYLLGPTWSDSYQGALPLSDSYNTIFLIPSATVTTIHTDKQFFKNVFSTYYRTDLQGKNYLKLAGKENIKSLYVLVQNDPYYEDFASYIVKRAEELGAKIVYNKVPAHTVDFRTKLIDIKNQKPDMVLVGFGSDQEYHALYQQRKELGLDTIPFYNSELIAEFGPNPEYKELLKNTYYVGFEPIPDVFTKKYRERFNVDPVFAASIAYDSVYILKNAIEHTDGTTDAVRVYLETHQFDTVTYGKTGFDKIHGVDKTNLDLFRYNSEIGDYEVAQ